VLLLVGIGGEGRICGGGWREEEERDELKVPSRQGGKWMEAALASPFNPGTWGSRGANRGGRIFFSGNGGLMRDLNGPFFTL
jgi:hypothetical protein